MLSSWLEFPIIWHSALSTIQGGGGEGGREGEEAGWWIHKGGLASRLRVVGKPVDLVELTVKPPSSIAAPVEYVSWMYPGLTSPSLCRRIFAWFVLPVNGSNDPLCLPPLTIFGYCCLSIRLLLRTPPATCVNREKNKRYTALIDVVWRFKFDSLPCIFLFYLYPSFIRRFNS